jgi:hypothetical protein
MNIKKIFGFAAIAGLLFVAAPAERAQALSLNGPGIAAAVQTGASDAAVTEVQYRRHHRGYHPHRGYGRPHHGFRHHRGYHRGPHFAPRHHHGHRRGHYRF